MSARECENCKPRIATLAELRDLAENTVIRDSEPSTVQLMDGDWYVTGSNCVWSVEDIALPATVIYSPEES